MAALTFNPLVLSAKRPPGGAAVRRSVAVKASKKAAFAVRADDDMDFVSGVPGLSPFLPPRSVERGDRRRACRPPRVARPARHLPTDTPRNRDARGVSHHRARRPRASRGPIRRLRRATADGRSSRHPVVVATDPRALPSSPPSPSQTGEIGLGEEMEDMLAKAAGGSSVPVT